MKALFLSTLLLVMLPACTAIQINTGVQIAPTTKTAVVAASSAAFVTGAWKYVDDHPIIIAASPDSPREYGRMFSPPVEIITDPAAPMRGIDCPDTTRAVDPCPTDTRAVVIGETVDLRAISKAVMAEKDRIAQTNKYDLIDLKERQRREEHNCKVAQDQTLNRSTWSKFIGFFGVHRKLQPLPGTVTTTVSTTVTTSPPPPTQVTWFQPATPSAPPIPMPTQPAPVNTAQDGSFTVPPAHKSVDLEARVSALEGKMDKILAILAEKK